MDSKLEVMKLLVEEVSAVVVGVPLLILPCQRTPVLGTWKELQQLQGDQEEKGSWEEEKSISPWILNLMFPTQVALE